MKRIECDFGEKRKEAIRIFKEKSFKIPEDWV